MNNIIAAVDFSHITEKVVDAACGFVQSRDAKLWLIHVAAPEPEFVGYTAGPPSVRDDVAHHLQAEHRKIQAVAQEVRNRGIDAAALLIQGPTVETILKEANKLSADLIVVGSHGHGAIYRALVGTVTEGVLQGSGA